MNKIVFFGSIWNTRSTNSFSFRHIQEHMEVPMDTSKMSEQELQFHYFKMHDADNNNKLDGCELIKSLIHWHGEFFFEQFSLASFSVIFFCTLLAHSM